jgi:hypothetical protein
MLRVESAAAPRDAGRHRRQRLVSALIGKPGSAPDIVVRAFIDDKIEVVASPLLIAELERVLARPKFRRYIDHETATEFVMRIQRHATMARDPEKVPTSIAVARAKPLRAGARAGSAGRNHPAGMTPERPRRPS